MTPDQVAFWQNAATAAGMAVLAVPAFGLNFRRKALARIGALVDRRARSGDASALDAIATEVRAERERRAGAWRRADEVCLVAGYVLLLGAAVWRLVG